MRKAALSLISAVIAGVVFFSAAARAQNTAASRDLLAHGDEDGLWLARVQTVHDRHLISEQTRLYYREYAGGWSELFPSITTRVVSLASSGGELLAVLDDGRWMIVNPRDMRIGRMPAGSSRMLTIASNRNDVWAVILVQPAKAATRRLFPSTEMTGIESTTFPAATSPSTHPAGDEPKMYVFYLDKGQWVDQVEAPEGTPKDPAGISMAVVNQLPAIACRGADSTLNVYRLKADHAWADPVRISLEGAGTNFKLLAIQNSLAVWVQATPSHGVGVTTAPSIDAGRLLTKDDFSQSMALELSTAQDTANQTVTTAFGHLRWLGAGGDKPVVEQTFELDGKAIGAVATISGPKSQEIPLRTCILIGVGVVLAAVAAGIRTRMTRTPPAFVSADQVEEYLAPAGIRFAAGLIDLLPCLAAMTLVHPIYDNQMTTLVDPDSVSRLSWIAVATYVLHTMAAEMICGQSVGKIIFGLYVVQRDGSPANAVGIALRNIFRILDLFLLPLTTIFFTPLRQRIGDLAGGTVVVGENPESEEED